MGTGDALVQLQAQLQVQQEHLLRQEQMVNAMQSQLKEFQMQTKIYQTHQDYGIGEITPTSNARTGRL